MLRAHGFVTVLLTPGCRIGTCSEAWYEYAKRDAVAVFPSCTYEHGEQLLIL